MCTGGLEEPGTIILDLSSIPECIEGFEICLGFPLGCHPFTDRSQVGFFRLIYIVYHNEITDSQAILLMLPLPWAQYLHRGGKPKKN